MKTKIYYLILSLCLCGTALFFSACSDNEEEDRIVGTWYSDENSAHVKSTWTFKSNGDFESHLITSGWNEDQPRMGTYVLNSNILTINIRAIAGNNSAYTQQFAVTTLTKKSLVLIGEDGVKSFSR